MFEQIFQCNKRFTDIDSTNFDGFEQLESKSFNDHVYFNGSNYVLNPNIINDTHSIIIHNNELILDGAEQILLTDLVDCFINEDFTKKIPCKTKKLYHMMFDRQSLTNKLYDYFNGMCHTLSNFPVTYTYYCINSVNISNHCIK